MVWGKISMKENFMKRVFKKVGLLAVLLVLSNCEITINIVGGVDEGNVGEVTTNENLGVPANVLVSAVGTNATVSWDPVAGATGYHLYYSLTPGVTNASTKVSNILTTSYVQGGFSDGDVVYFRVTAYDALGESLLSNEVSVTITAFPSTTLTSAVLSAPGQVTLTWDPVPGATAYHLYYANAPGVSTASTQIAGVTSPYVFNDPVNSSTTYFVVTATDGVTESGVSNELSATSYLTPGAPTITGITNPAETSLTITWSAGADALSYNIYYSLTPGVTTGSIVAASGVTGPTYTHTGLVAGQTYYYAIEPVSGPYTGVLSNEMSKLAGGICGNGAVEFAEVCDDGNASSNDACTNACQNNICGDGVIYTGFETCDDGNTASGDGCSATCTVEACVSHVVMDDSEWETWYGTKPQLYTDITKTPYLGDYSGNSIDESGYAYRLRNLCPGTYYAWARTMDHPGDGFSDKSYGYFDWTVTDTPATADMTLVDSFGWLQSGGVVLAGGDHTWRFGSVADGNFYTVSWDQFVITSNAGYTPPAGAETPVFWLHESFESGIGAWTFGGGPYTYYGVDNTTFTDGAQSLRLEGGSSHYNGLQHIHSPGVPSYIRFDVKCPDIPTTGQAVGYFVLESSTPGAHSYWFYCINTSGTQYLTTSSLGTGGAIYTGDTWNTIEFRNMNFTTHTYDFYVNGVQIATNVAFWSASANDAYKIHLYNFSAGYTTYYDNFYMK